MIRALPLLLLALGLPAQAATTTSQLKGDFLSATAWVTDDACQTSWVNVWSSETQTKGKGGSVALSQGVYISVYDSCVGSYDVLYGADLSGLSFGKGKVSGTVTAESYYTGATQTLSLDLAVGAVTSTQRGVYSNRSRWTGGSMHWRSNSAYTTGDGSGTLDGQSVTGASLTWGTSTSGSVTVESF